MTGFARARLMLPLSDRGGRDQRIEDGYVLYRDDEILEVGSYDDETGRRLLATHGSLDVLGGGEASTVEQLVCHDGVLLPGFIKAHGHDHESPIIGMVKDVPLTAWLDGAVNVFTRLLEERETELRDELGDSPHFLTYLKAKADDLYYGITSAMTHHCNFSKYRVDELARASEQAGTRIIIAVGSQDRNYYDKLLDKPPTVATDRLDRALEKHGDKTRTAVIPGPDQLFSNGPEILKALKAWAREHGTLLHCHSSEELGTTEWFKKEYGQTPVQYARDLGILDEQTVLAHQVHTTDEDLAILRDTGTRIVHNPLANTILGSGMPRIMDMLDAGIPVAVSTDGSGSADSQNILASARLASQYQKALHRRAENLPAQQVLEMITIIPAEILGINAGSLEPGKAADLVLVDLRRPNMIPTRKSNVVENLIWASDGSEVRYVVAGGRVVKDDYQLTTVDVADVGAKIQHLGSEIDRYKTEIGELRGTGANR
ncbi:MAG: amidohydrolase family protein [Deltaproteobacteria bacterium]|nr:amidohydrolase family protein [Deltaproteobacteria bacterium]MBW2530913.1 amidohydrolase family protein [Deltaproteobacteria bacterium]